MPDGRAELLPPVLFVDLTVKGDSDFICCGVVEKAVEGTKTLVSEMILDK